MDNFKIYTDKDIRTVYSSSPEIVTIPIGDESVPKPGDIYYTDGVNVRSSKLIGKWDSEVFTLGDNGLCNACDMVLDSSGNIYVTGFITGNVTLGSFPLTLSGGTRSAFVGKMNSSGVWQWAKAIGNSSRTEGLYIVLDSLDNVYIAGNFTGATLTVGGLTTLTSNNTSGASNIYPGNVFIVKMDNNGNYIWSYNNGSTDTQYWTFTRFLINRPIGLVIDDDDFLYVGYNTVAKEALTGNNSIGYILKITSSAEALAISNNSAVEPIEKNGVHTMCTDGKTVKFSVGDNQPSFKSHYPNKINDTLYNENITVNDSVSPFLYSDTNTYIFHTSSNSMSVNYEDFDTLIHSFNNVVNNDLIDNDRYGLLKTSHIGDLMWDTQFNAAKFIPRALVADSNGDMYTVATFLAPLHINNKIVSNKVEGEWDGIVIKIDKDDGQVLGMNILYGTGVMMRNAVMHSDDVLYITGQHTTLNLENKDSTITETQTTEESFIIKLDTTFDNGMEPVFISADPSMGSVQVQII